MFKTTQTDEVVTVTFSMTRKHRVKGRGKHVARDIDRAEYTEQAWRGFFAYGETRKYADGCPTKIKNADGKVVPMTDAQLDAASGKHIDYRYDQARGKEEWNGTTRTAIDPVVKLARKLAIGKLRAHSVKIPEKLKAATSRDEVVKAVGTLKGVKLDAAKLFAHAAKVIALEDNGTY